MRILLAILTLGLFSTSSFGQSRILSDCRQIENINERVACYDAIVDAAQLSVDSNAVSNNVPATAVTETPVRSIESSEPAQEESAQTNRETEESLFGRAAQATRRILERDLGVQQLDQIEAKISDSRTNAYGKIIVELENGQTWLQVDSDRLRLREGDEVTIRSGRMGAFFLEKSSGSRSIRVRRL